MKQLIFAFFLCINATATHELQCMAPSHVGRYFYDTCLMRCVCTEPSSQLFEVKCYREREDFTCMDEVRRQRYLDAYIAVSNTSHPLYGQFSYLISKHRLAFSTVHTTRWFLPWHRAYLLELENLLRRIDCRITVPYWPYANNPTDPFSSLPFGDQWMGDNGDPNNNYYVPDSQFGIPWIPPSKGTYLTREYLDSPIFPTLTLLNQIMATAASAYGSFSDQLQYSYHNGIHVSIGGDMATVASPYDPIFFLVHANVDRAWDTWQKSSTSKLNAYGSFSTTATMPFMFDNLNFNSVKSLELSGIRYVKIMSDPLGLNHSSVQTCSLVLLTSGWVSVQTIETKILTAPLNTLLNIPQIAPTVMSDQQQEIMTMMLPPEMQANARTLGKQYAAQTIALGAKIKNKIVPTNGSSTGSRSRSRSASTGNNSPVDVEIESSDETENSNETNIRLRPRTIQLSPISIRTGIDLDQIVQALNIPAVCPPDVVNCVADDSAIPGLTQYPSVHPTKAPTPHPSTRVPTTRAPTKAPTTRIPTQHPTTRVPTTRIPTFKPTTRNPTFRPTTRVPTFRPSTRFPSSRPTRGPTILI